MTNKILIFSRIADRFYKPIREKLPDAEIYAASGSKNLGIKPDEVTILVSWIIKPALIKQMTSLKWIHSLGAGVDGFFKEPEILQGKILTRSVANLPELIAQYVTAAVLSDNTGLYTHRRNQSLKKWDWQPFLDINYKKAVIVGTGKIGTEICKALKFFGMEVFGLNRSGTGSDIFDGVFGFSAWQDIFPRGDYVILALPLTDETRDLIDYEKLKSMKSDAMLVNIARGAIVHEEDLVKALDKSLFRHAFLDVFHKEPLPKYSPLWDHPKITITPHIAGVSDPNLVAEEFVKNYLRYMRGETLNNVVDVKRGY